MFPNALRSALSLSRFSRARRVVAMSSVALVAAAGLTLAGGAGASVADTTPVAPAPATVSADALPTTQVNGVVWAQVVVGTTVYATGSFTQARPAGVALGGAGTVTRSNLLAYNITTGVLSTTFVHSLNAQGLAIAASKDGSTVYVGGQFTTVDGVSRSRIAAFSTATGALLSTFAPVANGTVRAIVTSPTAVYLGGDFTQIGSSFRNHIGAVSATGVPVSTFNPGADLSVLSLALSGDGLHLVAGGRFGVLGGITAVGMGAVNPITGAAQPWAANTVIKDSGANSAIYSLSSDATQIYGTGYFYTAGGNFEGRFAADPATGRIVWMNNCHGDSYSSFPIGNVLYSVGHAHDCNDAGDFVQDDPSIGPATAHRALAEQTTPNGLAERHALFISGPNSPTYHDFFGEPTSNQLDWYPTIVNGTYTGQGQGAWSVTGNASYIVLGGEFPVVNSSAQQGLVRFAVAALATNKVAPTKTASLTPIVSSQSAGTARVAWQAAADRDNEVLTYAVYRDSIVAPVYTTTAASRFWKVPNLGFVDTGLAAGSTHTYKVTARDSFGNTITSSTSSVTVTSGGFTTYASRVRADGATHYWPLSEGSGALGLDRAGYGDLNLAGSYTRGAAGPITNGGTATTFAGGYKTGTTPNDTASTVGTQLPNTSFSIEGWFKTTSTAGGAIIDLGLYATKESSMIDKTLYIDNAGRVQFGIQNNLARLTAVSPGSYRNGAWHYAVGTFSGGVMTLYVDGVRVASRSGVTNNIAYPGYWRIGGDNLAGWPSRSGNYLAGSIASVGVYPTALTAAQVTAHWSLR